MTLQFVWNDKCKSKWRFDKAGTRDLYGIRLEWTLYLGRLEICYWSKVRP